MKKCVFIIFLMILLSGCSNQYNIKIEDDNIEESIISSINVDEIPSQNSFNKKYGIEVDDQITPFINNDQYPLFDDYSVIYEKNVKDTDDGFIVTLKHKYTFDEFKNSKAYNCFERKVLNKDGKDYLLYFSGSFYCMHGDNLTINLTTNNVVKSHNADKVSGKTYSWFINESNLNNFELKFSYTTEHLSFKSFFVVIAVCISFVFLVVLIVAFIKHKNIQSNKF